MNDGKKYKEFEYVYLFFMLKNLKQIESKFRKKIKTDKQWDCIWDLETKDQAFRRRFVSAKIFYDTKTSRAS